MAMWFWHRDDKLTKIVCMASCDDTNGVAAMADVYKDSGLRLHNMPATVTSVGQA